MFALTKIVSSLYLFGLSSWKPWLLSGGLDVTRSVMLTRLLNKSLSLTVGTTCLNIFFVAMCANKIGTVKPERMYNPSPFVLIVLVLY